LGIIGTTNAGRNARARGAVIPEAMFPTIELHTLEIA